MRLGAGTERESEFGEDEVDLKEGDRSPVEWSVHAARIGTVHLLPADYCLAERTIER